jgi:hypothetical protein
MGSLFSVHFNYPGNVLENKFIPIQEALIIFSRLLFAQHLFKAGFTFLKIKNFY